MKKAKEKYGIEILVDLIPHVNQNFKQLPEWSIVKARSFGKIIRRLATDGSVNHEDGLPVEWHDSVVINWRDIRVLYAYETLIRRLAKNGIKGARIDVAHHFGVMLPAERSLNGKQKLFGHVTSWERKQDGGFKVVNHWHGGEGNPLLVYLVSHITKDYPDFIFVGENYGKDIQLLKSGVMPMETGTYSDLQKVIMEGGSTQTILNGHFRWLSNELPKGSQMVGALETHDFFRVMDRWQHYGPRRLKAAIWTWLATTRGPIMIYNRQEEGVVHRVRIDNYTWHNYAEADRQRYYAQLEFENLYKETVQQFYQRALNTYRRYGSLHTGNEYLINTHHDRIFAIARFNKKEKLIFVINEWWETAFAGIDLAPLQKQLEIESSSKQFYMVTDLENGREEVFTGKELLAEGIRLTLGSYQPAVLAVRKVRGLKDDLSDGVGSLTTNARGRALRDALKRYSEQYRPRRIKVNNAFRWLEKAVLHRSYAFFHERFSYLARIVESRATRGQLNTTDLTVIMHDMAVKHPKEADKMKRMLESLTKRTEDELVREAAQKVRRWMDVGAAVFVSPEAVPYFKAGGMANVVGELAMVLAKSGLKVYVVLPQYQNLDKSTVQYTGKVAQIFLGRHGHVAGSIAEKYFEDVDYVFLDNPYFADALYGQSSKEHESLRAAFLSLGALEAMKALNIHPRIIIERLDDGAAMYLIVVFISRIHILAHDRMDHNNRQIISSR